MRALFVAVLVALIAAPLAALGECRITAVSGEVYYYGAGSRGVPARAGQLVRSGERVETGRPGHATINVDGHVVELGSLTYFMCTGPDHEPGVIHFEKRSLSKTEREALPGHSTGKTAKKHAPPRKPAKKAKKPSPSKKVAKKHAPAKKHAAPKRSSKKASHPEE